MKYIFCLCILSLVLGNSCTKDYLNSQPSGATIAKNAFKTSSDYESALNGCYSGLQDVGYYGRNFPVIGEILADNVKPSTDNLSRFTDLYNYSQTSSDQYLKEFWRAGYAVIHRCNTLITAVKQDSVILSATERNKYLGQALGLRALAHFDLFRVFAPRYDAATADIMLTVPLIVDTTFKDSIAPMQKATAAVLIKQITADLTQSKILLDKQAFSSLYFNRYAAMGLLARIYLYIGEYVNANNAASEIIKNQSISLVSNGQYINSWTEASSSESIFTLSFNKNDFDATESLGYLYNKNGYRSLVPTSDICKLYNLTDIRKKLIVDGFCNKFQSKENIVGLSNFQIIRLSEIYLIAAESIMRYSMATNTSHENTVISFLDIIRQRSDTYAISTKLSGQLLLNAIMVERQKELCFEGQRFFDLKRTMTSISRSDCSSQVCTLEYANSKNLYTMPIPISEINANHKISQNEGY